MLLKALDADVECAVDILVLLPAAAKSFLAHSTLVHETTELCGS